MGTTACVFFTFFKLLFPLHNAYYFLIVFIFTFRTSVKRFRSSNWSPSETVDFFDQVGECYYINNQTPFESDEALVRHVLDSAHQRVLGILMLNFRRMDRPTLGLHQ